MVGLFSGLILTIIGIYFEYANQLANQVLSFLENEVYTEYIKNRYYGTKFDASNVVKKIYKML